jgi:hypothetical protein
MTANQYVVRYSLKANAGDAASLAATSLSSRQRTDQANPASSRKYILQPAALGQEVTLDFKLAKDPSDVSVDSVFTNLLISIRQRAPRPPIIPLKPRY